MNPGESANAAVGQNELTMQMSFRKWYWVLALLSLCCGVAATIWGLSNEFYVDPQSGVRMRGFPIAGMTLPAYWESPRLWRLNVIGFTIDVLLWATPPFVLGCLILRIVAQVITGKK